MKRCIFFDLETSDREPIGQILNYSFISVDREFNQLAECTGDIRLSRLQLPSPGAILTNRVNVLNQQNCELTEVRAMQLISQFIAEQIDESRGPVGIAGFNSSRFDIPFLRTSLIRNGMSPYFSGKLIYRDVLLAARKLSVTNPDFPRFPAIDATGEDAERLSLSLENLSNRLELMTGKQSHHSKDDALLTIKLARLMRDEFELDIFDYEAYELRDLHKGVRSGVPVSVAFPNYKLDKDADLATIAPFALLDADHRSALWIDLDRYKEGKGRASISWFTLGAHGLIRGDKKVDTQEYRDLASRALKEFEKLNIKNFFAASTCDIEQDIYRLDFDALDALHAAIWKKDLSALKEVESRDARVLYKRFELANYSWGSGDDDRIKKMLGDYANYRYGGKLVLSKFADGDRLRVHPTLQAMVIEAETAISTGSKEDRSLLVALIEYYQKSEIWNVLPSVI